MSISTCIYEALDDFGLITSAEAKELGVSNQDMVNLAHRGKLERVAQGVYRAPIWPYQEAFPYALAVKAAGPDAVLYGESVLALLGLVPTNPARMWLATTSRTRRNLGKGTTITRLPAGEVTTYYEGVPCQSVADAILASAKTIGKDRALEAAEKAVQLGYINTKQFNAIMDEIGHGKAFSSLLKSESEKQQQNE